MAFEESGPSPSGRADPELKHARDLTSLMTSKVGDVHVREPIFFDGDADIVTVCRALSREGLDCALVRDAGQIGVFTTTDLLEAVLRPESAAELAVREVTCFEPPSVSVDDDLYDAMRLMLLQRVGQVVVRRGETVVGLLSQLDLITSGTRHAYLIPLQTARARDLAELKSAARQIDSLIAILHDGGLRVDLIGRLVGKLNRQVFLRLWELLAPETLRANSCLIVMGSEGRGEQIIKTDQDNALLLRDGFVFDGLETVAEAFTAALLEFDYPLCPGGIMLSRPLWCQPVSRLHDSLREWIHGADPDGPMNLAIFLDAAPVAGDATLLAEARDHVDRLVTDSDAFFARFASAVERFGDDGGWWSRLPRLRGQAAAEVDVKKLGIFPLVHGVRALALQYHVRALGTVDRLRALVAKGHIEEPMARDLIDALHFLIGLKLATNLRQIAEGRAPDNLVLLSERGSLERQSLKETLAIVRRFKQWLGRHFRLDVL